MATNSSWNVGTAATGKVLQGAGVGTVSSYSTATYPSTATTTGQILRADGTNWTGTTATYPNTAGTSANVLTSDGTNWVSSAATGPSGGPLQQKRTSTTATTGLTTRLPCDNTIPQITEGTQILSLAITPTNTAHVLEIYGVIQIGFENGGGGSTEAGIALFQDATTNSIYACYHRFKDSTNAITPQVSTPIPFHYYMAAGTTSSTTFTLRAGFTTGVDNVAALNCQDDGSTRVFGGVSLCTLFITEWGA